MRLADFRRAICGATALVGLVAVAAHAHHSFAMYDQNAVRVFTGVVTRVHPDANHLQIFFVPMNEARNGILRNDDGEPQVWMVEMAGAAMAARQGISVNTFSRGTVFSVALNPLRNGNPAGARVGPLIRCPEGTPPPSGQHCEALEGSVVHAADGEPGGLPAPTLEEG